jgi:hypothetical protein
MSVDLQVTVCFVNTRRKHFSVQSVIFLKLLFIGMRHHPQKQICFCDNGYQSASAV